MNSIAGNQEDKDYSMKCQFLTLRLSIFHCVTLMIAAAACLEAQTRLLPKPTKVRVVSIVIEPSPVNQPPTVSGPQAYVDTTYVPPTGQTITVGVGGNFQAALDKAKPGDVITLAAGASYSGSFTLPVKSGAGYIVVRSSTPDANLPPVGTRITPAARNLMPRIVGSAGTPALVTAPGAHHFRFIAVEFAPANGIYIDTLIRLGMGNDASLADLPHHLIFDRCFIHGDPVTGGKRGVGFNGASLAVIDSYLSDWKGVGQDTQAIASWNGPGPFKIVNNYLEAAGENIMFGGADAKIAGLVPSNIEIRGNHVFKPLSWKVDDPSYAGTNWTVKNLLELKNASRVLIADNLFENCWAHAQVGFAIVFTVRNQDRGNPWATVSDVTFTHNVVRNSANGFNLLGYDTESGTPSQTAKRLLIQHNLLTGIGQYPGSSDGIAFQILNGYEDLTIDHNTAVHTGSTIIADALPSPRLRFTNNIVIHNSYGIKGTDFNSGNTTIAHYFPESDIRGNVIVMNAGNFSSQYPAGNYYPTSLGKVGFVNLTNYADLRLDPASAYHNRATDGSNIGAETVQTTQK